MTEVWPGVNMWYDWRSDSVVVVVPSKVQMSPWQLRGMRRWPSPQRSWLAMALGWTFGWQASCENSLKNRCTRDRVDGRVRCHRGVEQCAALPYGKVYRSHWSASMGGKVHDELFEHCWHDVQYYSFYEYTCLLVLDMHRSNEQMPCYWYILLFVLCMMNAKVW